MTAHAASLFRSDATLREGLVGERYYASDDLVLTLLLAARLEKPLLLEGRPGVGKTSIAGALAAALDTPLVRLQCYEGLDSATSLYEWNHAKQILRIRMAELDDELDREQLEQNIFSDEFLLARPLLQALRHDGDDPAVLLIDEIDRADEEFEAFLLEVLSEFQISVPELGVIKATRIPLVVLTSNGTRELSDALRRRCLYQWIDLPSPEQEREIVRQRVPGIEARLADEVVAVVEKIRGLDLEKPPGISETLDWASALVALEQENLSAELLHKTQSCLVKSNADARAVAEAADAWF